MFSKITLSLATSAVLVSSFPFSSVSAAQATLQVCHKAGTPAESTLTISANAKAAHERHGDYEGACRGLVSSACTALNENDELTVTSTAGSGYYYEYSDMEFFPGETIHVAMTISLQHEDDFTLYATEIIGDVGPLESDGGGLVGDLAPHTASNDYTVTGVEGLIDIKATIDDFAEYDINIESLTFSCTANP